MIERTVDVNPAWPSGHWVDEPGLSRDLPEVTDLEELEEIGLAPREPRSDIPFAACPEEAILARVASRPVSPAQPLAEARMVEVVARYQRLRQEARAAMAQITLG